MSFATNPPSKTPNGSDDIVRNSDSANFGSDVIEASAEVPVIVDFWSRQSGLCRQISPIIEKLVRQSGGKVRLVKIDVDSNQTLAMQLRIQTIPSAMAFHKGRPVDAFSGAQTENQLRDFVSRLAGKAGAGNGATVEDADSRLSAGDIDHARLIYDEILSTDPSNGGAVGGKIRCELAAGNIDKATGIVDGLDDKIKTLPAVESAINALELAISTSDTGDVEELVKKVSANQNDHAARFDLAMTHYANGNIDGAIDELLELVRLDRKWNDEAARKQLVKIFTARGFNDPLTVSGRKRLSVILFS